MAPTKTTFGLAAILAILILTGVGHGANEKIKWLGYEEGVALSEQDGKKLFLHFYTDWCNYCAKMDKETFSDSAVISYLNRHFISVRVNSEKQRDVALKYAVRGVPMTWFVSETNERISSLPGYIDRDMLINILRFVNTDSYKSMTFKEFTKTL